MLVLVFHSLYIYYFGMYIYFFSIDVAESSVGPGTYSNGDSNGLKLKNIVVDSVTIEELKAEPKTYNTINHTSE